MRFRLLPLLLLLHAPLAAQRLPESRVPTLVSVAMHSRYKGNAAVQWYVSADTLYEARFNWRGSPTMARFSATGLWLETATVIGAISMPDSVRSSLIREFRGYRIAEARRIDRPEDPRLLFEVDVQGADGAVRARFDSSGRVRSRGPLIAGGAPDP